MLVCVGAGFLLSGCLTPVGVEKVGAARAREKIEGSVLTSGVPTATSRSVLHRFGLEDRYRQTPDPVLEFLHAAACRERQRDILFALSELNFLAARRGAILRDDDGRWSSRPYYFAASVYAYLYLFGDFEEPLQKSDQQDYKLARDLYNRGLIEALRDWKDQCSIEETQSVLPVGSLRLKTVRSDAILDRENVRKIVFADDYRVRGLSRRTRTDGFGAPLIVHPSAARIAETDTVFLRPGRHFAATALLQVEGDLCALNSNGVMNASLEIYHAEMHSDLRVRNHTVLLERDLTVSLASELEGSPVWVMGLIQFLTFHQHIRNGLYVFTPYQPGKVPVVFIHGTAGQPADWAEMLNELGADPELRERIQPWHFVYNSGNPIAFSAANLRSALTNIVAKLDPDGNDPALRRMVLVGHSQGGLLARMMVCSSGDISWSPAVEERLNNLKASPAEREMFRRCLQFEASPYVARAVFIATPHGGSRLVGSAVERLALGIIDLPVDLVRAGTRVLPAVRPQQDRLPRGLRGLPTSVSNMKPGSAFIKALPLMPISTNVTTHSIIAVLSGGPHEKGHDGLVSFESARLPGTRSEHIVRCNHSCQSNPTVINEVRRILLEP